MLDQTKLYCKSGIAILTRRSGGSLGITLTTRFKFSHFFNRNFSRDTPLILFLIYNWPIMFSVVLRYLSRQSGFTLWVTNSHILSLSLNLLEWAPDWTSTLNNYLFYSILMEFITPNISRCKVIKWPYSPTTGRKVTFSLCY